MHQFVAAADDHQIRRSPRPTSGSAGSLRLCRSRRPWLVASRWRRTSPPRVPKNTRSPSTAGVLPVGDRRSAPRPISCPSSRSTMCSLPSQPATNARSVDHGRRAADLVVDREFPDQLAADGIQGIERGVLRAEQHHVLVEVRGRVDFGRRLRTAHSSLPSAASKAVELAVGVADVDPAVAHGRRGREAELGVIFPSLLAGRPDRTA